ncbi:hypothetical protein ACFVT2_13620 [Streptomyces sp. NPDC058000]
MVPVPGMTGEVEALALYAGQSAGLIRNTLPAAQIVASISDQAQRIISGT